MTHEHRYSERFSNASDSQEWHDSQTLFLLTCYDIWSATPPRRCAALFDTDRPA